LVLRLFGFADGELDEVVVELASRLDANPAKDAWNPFAQADLLAAEDRVSWHLFDDDPT
jgi:hypothetical protein